MFIQREGVNAGLAQLYTGDHLKEQKLEKEEEQSDSINQNPPIHTTEELERKLERADEESEKLLEVNRELFGQTLHLELLLANANKTIKEQQEQISLLQKELDDVRKALDKKCAAVPLSYEESARDAGPIKQKIAALTMELEAVCKEEVECKQSCRGERNRMSHRSPQAEEDYDQAKGKWLAAEKKREQLEEEIKALEVELRKIESSQ